MSNVPQVGELVIGLVKEVKDYGAYIEIDEYPGYEGFVHVSEVSLKWVRNIREHLKEGQRTVFKIIRVNPATLQADLSIRRVSQRERMEKLLEVKKASKVKRVLKILEETAGPQAVEKIYTKTRDANVLYEIFEQISADQPVNQFFPELDDKEAEELRRAVEHEIRVREHEIKADIVMRSEARNGVMAIREAAAAAEQLARPGELIEIKTKGAPVYSVHIKASNRERTEELLEKVVEKCGEVLKRYGGVAEVKAK
ncbi:MAG: S1 RNA-binding domain-containing protein [Candidatus Caldarchaeum sp.]